MKLPDIAEVTTAEQATELAIEYQDWASEQDLSYGELLEWQSYLTELADKFELKEEFEENGVI